MHYLSKAYIYLTIFGESFSPADLTKELGLQPTRVGLKGQPSKYTRALKECFWEYQLEETNALEGLEFSLEKLIDIFDDKVSIISSYTAKNDLNVKCFVVIKSKNNEDTGVLFIPKFIHFLHQLGASLEVDNYNSND